ncbi:HtaA domain-containing protein [Microbacterium caowuchunii]|uniref:LPXTG cell wall anchor domain-containing protein n=1 Tax=Microbacterium caowuchunii TaxID=2614638 RepID=A0A5N0THL1_9MICO|nr:HtaA domain-containing protein [Microbacterium caowuchunii]KAA9134600.1 LPXTG cell wall anchor domain-containing protein [Microbacterium caowuchunii]
MQKTRRASLRRVLASVLTGALIASGAALGLAIPASAVDGPSVETTLAPRDGGPITVRGQGFSTEGNGIYLGLRVNGGAEDVPGTTVWIDDANVEAMTGAGATAPMAADGTFAVSVSVPAFDASNAYEVYTRGAHGGGSGTSQETRTPVSYEPAPVPTVIATTTSLASSVNPAAAGDTVTLTATVTAQGEGASALAGTVTFAASGGTLGSAEVVNGVASFATATLAPGTYDITASFAPAEPAHYGVSASSTLSQVVGASSAPDPEPVVVPSVSLFLEDGVTPYTGQPVYSDDVLVVKGSGFDPAANVGGRGVPIPSHLPQGTYVVLGSFLEQWQPSTGAGTGARKVASQQWALAESVLDQVPAAYQDTVRAQWVNITADGTFSARLTAAKLADALPGGKWGVYTYPAGGIKNAAQETYTPVDYRGDEPVTPDPPVAAPTVTVTPSAPLDPNVENVLTLQGRNFTGAAADNGVYVAFGKTTVWAAGTAFPTDGWDFVNWVTPGEMTGGAFTAKITVPAGKIDPRADYQVVTSAAHNLALTDRSLDTRTAVAVAQDIPVERAIFLSSDSIRPGADLTVSGVGFDAGDRIRVEIHSDPIVLGSTVAGADGRFSVTGTVPENLGAGEHTVMVFVNGVAAAQSARLTVTAAPVEEAPAGPSCVAQAVSGASIQWSVKESFRSYVQGPIAKGSYSINWGSGSGAFSTETDRGRVSYGGSATFSGHGGLMNVEFTNPRVQVNSATSATLILNVRATKPDGSVAVNADGVAVASLSLPTANRTADRISWSGASATLTSAGAAAFAGFYDAGAALDPVSFSFPLGAEVECDSTTDGNLAATGAESSADVLWIGAGLFGLGLLLVVMRRRRANA